MAESVEGSDSFPIKLPSFIPNLFPFLKPKPPVVGNDKPMKVSGDGDSQKSTYDTVSFPYKPPKNAEPVTFEAEVNSGKTSNSLVLWQVYALGGFLVLKWAWARWNERNDRIDKKEKNNDEDDQPSHVKDDDDDDDQPSHVKDDDDDEDQPSHGHED